MAERHRRLPSKQNRRVRLPPGTLPADNGRPDILAVPVRSGRHALNVEIVGSNPIQGTDDVSAGHWRAQVGVTHAHCCAGSTLAPTHCKMAL